MLLYLTVTTSKVYPTLYKNATPATKKIGILDESVFIIRYFGKRCQLRNAQKLAQMSTQSLPILHVNDANVLGKLAPFVFCKVWKYGESLLRYTLTITSSCINVMYTHDVAKCLALWNRMQDLVFSSGSPWGRCLSQFLQVCSRSGSEETRREYTRTLSLLFSETQKAPDDITQEDVLSFIHSPSRSPRNPGAIPTTGTVNTRLAIIKAFYMFASTYTVTGPDGHPMHILQRAPPTTGIRTSKPSLEYRALSYQEMERLFSVIPETVIGLRDRACFLTYFWTARRRNEIARLCWGDIEPAVFVDEDEQPREGWIYHFKNKGRATKDDMAELPLPAKLAIDKYLIASGRMATIQPGDPLFVPTDMGNVHFDHSKQLTDTSIARRLKYYCKKAGLDTTRITIHSWRHTAARMRRNAGEPIEDIQHLLRHASLDMTYRYVNKLVTPSDPGAKRLEERFSRFS